MVTDIIQKGDSPFSNDSPNKTSSIETTDEARDDIDPKEERAFVWRLDLGFLIVGFLGYMFKYIDQTNIVSRTRLW